MLNFNNARTVANQMLSNARPYAENFIQKILDNIVFNKEHPTIDAVEYPSDFNMPEIDPYGVFDALAFCVHYTCYGEVRFRFDEASEQDSPAFRLLTECLMNNGFVCKDNILFIHPRISHLE